MAAATVHTVTYEPALARVRINLSGFQAGTTVVQIRRRNLVTGRIDLVRGARGIVIANPATDQVQVFDYEFPAGESVSYEYTQGAADATSWLVAAPGTFDVAQVWLKHVTRPYLNRTIVVRGYEPYTHDLRAGVYPVSRRTVPLGRLDVRAGRSWKFDVDAPTVAERDALDDFLIVGGVLLLHTPADCDTVPGGYLVITGAEERRVGRAHSSGRAFAMSVAEVAPPDPDVAGSGITWQAVKDGFATWADVVAAKPSWSVLLSTVVAPGEIVVV